jgi:NAD+ kinase
MLGVVGDDAAADAVRERADEVAVGDAAAVAASSPSAVVAVGEPALLALVRERVAAPVLAVDAGPGVPSVARDDLAAAVESLDAGEWTARDRRLLSVEVDDRGLPALADAMLVTIGPADISEYGVEAGGESTRFRADGVVVASPAGSHGYAASAGGPLVAPGTGAVAVVPVAPFTVDHRHWVLDPPVTLSVERDESAVSLLVDDRDRGALPRDAEVTVDWGGSVTFAVTGETGDAATLQ